MNGVLAVPVAGMAGFWIWVVLNDEDGLFAPVNRWAKKKPRREKWMTCPWCAGAWFAILGTAAFLAEGVARAAVYALAAAAVTGLLGSYFGED